MIKKKMLNVKKKIFMEQNGEHILFLQGHKLQW